MTDNPQWQAPGGEPAHPATASPAADVAGYVPPPATPGWTPPPKPGLIPLRPLDLGTILGASFRVLRRNPRPTFGIALVIQGIVGVISALIVGATAAFAIGRIGSSANENAQTITAGSVGIIGLSSIIPVLLAVVAGALLEGVIVVEVSRATLGEKQRFSQLWSRVKGRLGALIGWTFLLALALVVVLGLLVGLIVLFVATLGTAGIVVAVLLGIFGGLAFIVVGAWLSVKLMMVSSALMLERLTIRQAVARSWRLTDGYFWRTFGIKLLVSVILYFAQQVVLTPISVIGSLAIGLTDPNGQNSTGTIVFSLIYVFVVLVATVVFSSITAVVSTASTALLYLDLRIRKEGLDLELARFVEARQVGDTSVADPYLVVPPAPQPASAA